MTLVHDKHDALLSHTLKIGRIGTSIILDVAHLLDGRHNKSVSRIVALELSAQHIGILGSLHALRVISKITVFVK